ncbi:MAG: flagellar hook-basal body complex protein FliE [Desulfobacterales bacterium]|nr:MAG: flagellar hook-basal body complex protein FliE [Desulfobacterales bacterium]
MPTVTFPIDPEFPADFARQEARSPQLAAPSFADVLKRSVQEVNQLQIEADQSIAELAAGEKKDIHETMIAVQKAEISFQMLMEVRNKLVAAYETIMRMQV